MALRTRLIVGVSIVVALVLGIESFVEIRLFEETAERELRETGLVTAQSVADDLELRPTPLRAEDLVADLHEFAQSAPSIRTDLGRPARGRRADHHRQHRVYRVARSVGARSRSAHARRSGAA